MSIKTKLEKLIESYLPELIKESSGKNPTKEQISATIDLLKSVTKNSKFNNKVFIAGGAVRDMVMGHDPKDIDLVVEMENGGIEYATYVCKTLGIYKSSNPIVFPNFGTAKITFDGVIHHGISLDGIDVEVVNTRQEEYTPGSRKPITKFGTIEQDVFRRDLTINSLLMNLISGEILDLTGKGREDIAKGIIQTPSDPDQIFIDDPLRLLRAVRFAARYGYSIPDLMKKSIIKNVPELKNISKERIKEELEKIISGKNPDLGIKLLFDLGIFAEIFPEVANNKNQILSSIKQHRTDFIGTMALFLQGLEPAKVEKICHDLKMSNDETRAISLIANSIKRIVDKDIPESVLESGTDLFTKNLEKYIPLLPIKEKDKELIKFFSTGPKIHFTPNDLKQVFGLKPGPIYSQLMQLQKKLWYKNPEISKEEAEKEIRKALGQ